MAEGVCELIGFCLGILGLMGTSAVTGLPMWKVTAFIQENIIVMETRWEGLWMNCYRQANIRMQCKVYDSLLYLPPELQAARGLMCCSVGLSAIGLVASLPGLRCISCFPDQPRIKYLCILVAGSMQILAAVCVLIPVSWTANSIIRDFYNPLLIDAQRRELGDALYIGWVSAFVLVCSGLVFLLCQTKRSNRSYQPVYPKPFNYVPNQTPTPIGSVSHQALLFPSQHPSPLAYSVHSAPPGGQASLYNVPVVYPANTMPVQRHPSTHSSHNSALVSIPSVHPAVQSVPPAPVFYGTTWKGGSPHPSSTNSSSGVYI